MSGGKGRGGGVGMCGVAVGEHRAGEGLSGGHSRDADGSREEGWQECDGGCEECGERRWWR